MKLSLKHLFKFFIVLTLAVGFIPNIGAIDKVAPQWLFLNLIGSVFLLTSFYFNKNDLLEIFKNKTFKVLGLFLIWISCSYFYAINPVESLVVSSQYFSWILLFILFYFSLKSIINPFNFISGIISLYLIIEIFLILNPILSSGMEGGIQYRSNLYIGAAANINITAFSILYKIPFLVYFIQCSKLKSSIKLLISLLVVSSSFFIINTLLLTRSAILITILISLLYIFVGIYLKLEKKIITRFSSIFIFSILISYGLNTLVSNFYGSELSSSNRLQTITNTFSSDSTKKDGSISQRLNFYSQAIEQIQENPIFGVGIGNWKIKSIDYDKNNIVGYKVPYHVHNDFLELATEIGIIGMVLYLLIILISVITVLRLLKRNFLGHFNRNEFIKAFSMLLFFIIFFIDSMLNFPIARPIEIILFIMIISYVSLIKEYEKL